MSIYSLLWAIPIAAFVLELGRWGIRRVRRWLARRRRPAPVLETYRTAVVPPVVIRCIDCGREDCPTLRSTGIRHARGGNSGDAFIDTVFEQLDRSRRIEDHADCLRHRNHTRSIVQAVSIDVGSALTDARHVIDHIRQEYLWGHPDVQRIPAELVDDRRLPITVNESRAAQGFPPVDTRPRPAVLEPSKHGLTRGNQ